MNSLLTLVGDGRVHHDVAVSAFKFAATLTLNKLNANYTFVPY